MLGTEAVHANAHDTAHGVRLFFGTFYSNFCEPIRGRIHLMYER